MELGLKGKNVLITGINNPMGIGAATSLECCKEGANLALVYKRLDLQFDETKTDELGIDWYHKKLAGNAEEVEKLIKNTGSKYVLIEADITSKEEIVRMYDIIEKELGSVDILVNNAAEYDENDTIFTIAESGISKILDINVKGTLLMISEYIKRFKKRNGTSGRIISLSTDAAQVFPGQITYGASKATIEAFTRSIAIEVGHLGITVNAVAPGPTQTGWIDAESEQAVVPMIPLGRLGQPQDIANMILYLASEKASWLTGQVVKVSGGHAL